MEESEENKQYVTRTCVCRPTLQPHPNRPLQEIYPIYEVFILKLFLMKESILSYMSNIGTNIQNDEKKLTKSTVYFIVAT